MAGETESAVSLIDVTQVIARDGMFELSQLLVNSFDLQKNPGQPCPGYCRTSNLILADRR